MHGLRSIFRISFIVWLILKCPFFIDFRKIMPQRKRYAMNKPIREPIREPSKVCVYFRYCGSERRGLTKILVERK